MYVRAEQIRFRYNSSTGALYLADSQNGLALIGVGYSGAVGHQNSVSSETKVAKGPIPRGLWTLGVARRHQRLGAVAIPLHPQAGTEAFGRTGFYVHGDNARSDGSASTGCIIMPRTVREFLDRSGITTLEVF